MIGQIREGDATWDDLNSLRAEFYGSREHRDTTSKGAKILMEYMDADWIKANVGAENSKKVFSINADGTQSSEGKFFVPSEDCLMDANYLLNLHGYGNDWEIVKSTSSQWDTRDTEFGVRKLYSSKVTVKPKKNEWSIEDIDRYLENKEFKNVMEKIKPTNYDPDGEVLEICLPDVHFGLLGEDYNIEIAKSRFYSCINDIIERIGNRKFSKIYLVPLGDMLHVDNSNFTSSKGTLQSCDGGFNKMFDATLDIMIDCIQMLEQAAKTKIHVPYISGNHSRVMEYTLIKAIEVAFRNNDNITIDSSSTPSKFEQFGKVLIGWTHGECSIQNMSEWLHSHAREEFGRSLYSEVHSGHTHHTQTIEKSGMIIRHLPSICSSSPWEDQQLYGDGVKTVVSFVWNPNNGLRDMWYSNI